MTSYFDTDPLAIIDHPADANHHGPVRSLLITTEQPLFGVIHATGGTNSLAWLSTTFNSQVSCQRLITKKGVIYKILPDELTPWTQGRAVVGEYDGTPNINSRCLSMELENLNTGFDPYPLPQMRACAWQAAEWYGLYGAFPIMGHAWMQSDKSDPAGFDWALFYRLLFARLKASL